MILAALLVRIEIIPSVGCSQEIAKVANRFEVVKVRAAGKLNGVMVCPSPNPIKDRDRDD